MEGARGAKPSLERATGRVGSSFFQRSSLYYVLLLSLFLALPKASEAQGSLPLSQFGHTAWRVEDGLFFGTPQAISQTADGYMWIGTSVGLTRFDGVRFSPWTQWPAGREASSNVYALLGATDGSLWIASAAGLARIRGGNLSYLSSTGGRVNAFAQSTDGTVWFAQTRAADALCRIDQDRFACLGAKDGLQCHYGQSLSPDRNGGVWLGSDSGFCHWTKDSISYSNPLGQAETTATSSALTSLELDNGDVLVGYGAMGAHFGLQKLSSDGKWKSVEIPGLRGEAAGITTIRRDSRGDLWIGTAESGLYHISGGKTDHYGAADGLSADAVNDIYEDHEGCVWIATSSGIDIFRKLKVASFSTKQGFVTNLVTTVVSRADGTVASAGRDGMQILHDGQITQLRKGKELPPLPILSLLYDHSGTLWAGTLAEVGTIVSGKFQPLKGLKGKDGIYLDIVEDSENQIWIRGGRHIYKAVNGELVDTGFPASFRHGGMLTADPKSGIWILQSHGALSRILDGKLATVSGALPGASGFFRLLVQSNGQVWASGLGGLSFWDGIQWHKLDSQGGLPCDVVYQAMDDHRGHMWIYQRCGITVVADAELNAWSKKLQTKVHPEFIINPSDGAVGNFDDFNPSHAVSPDGRLWFADDGPLQMVDPSTLLFNSIPPPVHIEEVKADHRPYPPTGPLLLPASTRDVQIDYTGLSFVSPLRVHFRYNLSGVDKDWRDVGTRRQAFYMNLPPGTYMFEVQACNNDGVWSSTGATLEIRIAAAFYQTIAFRVLAGLALLGVLWAVYLIRLRSATAALEGRLLERYSERERIARELHDTLLQGFQAILLNFQSAVDTLPADSQTRALLERALDRAEGVLLSGRDRIRGLRSRTHPATLEAELKTVLTELESVWGKDFELISRGDPRLLKELVQTELLAIVCEALTNAAKHGNPSKILCEVSYEKARFMIACSDDGVGIDEEILGAGGRIGRFGLVGMRERARTVGATLDVERVLPHGTLVRVTLGRRSAYLL